MFLRYLCTGKRIEIMENPNYVMREFDQALNKIYTDGFDIEGDRTGVGTRALFGISTQYDVSKRVPIPTKRKVAWKSIVKEVLWYISGSHNINDLEKAGAKIWTPWKNDSFTEKHDLPKGSGGYIYGFNLIHFGADIKVLEQETAARNLYTNPDPQFTEFNKKGLEAVDEAYGASQGFNQLDYVINTLRANPKSRQACFTFWRPDTNSMAVLPACHAFYSFIVSPNSNGAMNVLNCHVFQRSADFPIGVKMGNLWTATLFMYMIAQQLDMKPGNLYHSGSHCHIYHNVMHPTAEHPNGPLQEYLSRVEEPNSPILHLSKKNSIYEYQVEDFVLEDYNPLPAIKFPIAV